MYPLLRPSASTILLLLSATALILLLIHPYSSLIRIPTTRTTTTTTTSPPPTAIEHILFGIASSHRSLPRRIPLLRLWHRPNLTRTSLLLDSIPNVNLTNLDINLLLSSDTSQFPYTFDSGLRSAVRVARVLKDLLRSSPLQGVRWVVLADDDTVFVPDNLVAVLDKYDWEQWYYVGSRSESLEQNLQYSFEMAFGGGGFAVSFPLARVLARVLDSCVVRYAHLYGSDARVFSCLAELGVALSHEPGFHQVDLRGDISGLLSSHPLSPLVSLHHLQAVEPIFPKMNKTTAIQHLFKAINVDPGRILQQTVCYDRSNNRTISVSWGYLVQVFEGNQLLPNLLAAPRTFTPWKRSRNISSSFYSFNTRELARDPCQRPAILFFDSVRTQNNSIVSNYSRTSYGKCLQSTSSSKNLKLIKVFSEKLHYLPRQAARRECCDVISSSKSLMEIKIRKCKMDELIAMNP